jgi:hypothetical protein
VPAASLDEGYRLMYGLDFEGARQRFLGWEQAHPDDPRGPMSEAASLLFSKLDETGVLQAQFFEENSSFTSNHARTPPDGEWRARFDAALTRAETLGNARLAADPTDHDALFALAMVHGLHADDDALLEGRSFAALSETREASRLAERLLAVAPGYADAYLATGISQYIIGSLAAPFRWILRLAGYEGNRSQGLRQLRITAEHGRLLGPFARILLAIAYLRSHEPARARALLEGLEHDFPSNPLFAREIQRLDRQGVAR